MPYKRRVKGHFEETASVVRRPMITVWTKEVEKMIRD